MKKIIIEAVEKYQCPGCVSGSDVSCYKNDPIFGIGCSDHCPGTMITRIGSIFLGMPIGFNRLGSDNRMKLVIYETFESSDWTYDMYNIPVWKHKNENGHTLVRGIMPRTNSPFLHVFLEDCIDKIDCLEISLEDISEMD